MKKNILLIQPRSAWGNHIYLVNGLLATATRLALAGFTYTIKDLNIDDEISQEEIKNADLIGISVLGSPYIPQAIKLAKNLRERGYDGRFFLGGPILENISLEDWQKLFQSNNLENVTPIQHEVDLKIELGILNNVPMINDCSIGKAIEALPEYMQRAYFEKEFCIFTSDGCIFNCTFCGAHKNRKETFRNPKVFREEMATIAKVVLKYAGPKPKYEIYLSTLDGLQNRETMEKTLTIIREEFDKVGVFVPLRFLATSKYTSMALKSDPTILKRWYELGVRCIGIGVDGDDEETWNQLRKNHNDRDEIRLALTGIQDAGMVAEAFMIFGGPTEKPEATAKAVLACKNLSKQGVKVRPYFMKLRTPKIWDQATKHTKEEEEARFFIDPFLENLDLFYHLEYAMLGSKLTNKDPEQRNRVNAAFLDVVNFLSETPLGCPTQPLLPTEDGDQFEKERAYEWNCNQPMDR
jgi:radical SAM superfamily enzyme